LHLISADSKNPVNDYRSIRKEVENFSKKLAEKNEQIVLTKKELINQEDLQKIKRNFKKMGLDIIDISSATHHNIDKLIYHITK
jgi:GTP-binding protein